MEPSDENTGGGEVKENVVDGSPDSKWLTFHPTGWVSCDLNTLPRGAGARTLYVRFDDSQPGDGCGPWLVHLTLDLDRP